MKTAHDYFAPGDIVFNHWGYDQTNIDFYRVTKVTNKFLTLEAISSITTKYYEDGGTEVIPGPDITLTGPYYTEQNGRHGIRIYDDDVLINFKYGGGYKWDGRPKHVSSPR